MFWSHWDLCINEGLSYRGKIQLQKSFWDLKISTVTLNMYLLGVSDTDTSKSHCMLKLARKKGALAFTPAGERSIDLFISTDPELIDCCLSLTLS